MTQAFNLALLANKVNSSGLLDASTALNNAVPVANGGTGLATLTANNLIVGNGTSAVQFIAPGTSGNFLTSNGTSWVSTAATLYGGAKSQIFTSGGTFTVPSGITSLKVTVIGGGGGGAYMSYNPSGCGPAPAAGGYGGMAIGYITVTSGSAYTITVGAGGAGAYRTTAGSVTGGSGGSSSFSTLISATGGGGGYADFNTSASIPGANGVGSSGTLSNTYTANGASGIYGLTDRSVASTAALTWSSTAGFVAGARGTSSGIYGSGAVSGVVLIEW